MNRSPVAIRKHAILKRHYRRAVAAPPEFHQLDSNGQWAVLRRQIDDDASPTGATLRTIMDERAPRRGEVLSALEEARRDSIREPRVTRPRGV
jgi:hypothetical protein